MKYGMNRKRKNSPKGRKEGEKVKTLREKKDLFVSIIPLLVLVWILVWPAEVFALASIVIPEGSKQRELVNAALKFLEDNKSDPEAGVKAHEELKEMLGKKPEIWKAKLRWELGDEKENWKFPPGRGETSTGGIKVALPYTEDVNTAPNTPEGFRQVKLLASILYHEWVHWRQRHRSGSTEYGNDASIAANDNWAGGSPEWVEVEAYYKQIKLLLEWKLDREKQRDKLPPPEKRTDDQQKQADRLEREIGEIKSEINTFVGASNTFLGAPRNSGGGTKSYEDNGNRLKDAFEGKTNEQKLTIVKDRLKNVALIAPRQPWMQSIEDKIAWKVQEKRKLEGPKNKEPTPENGGSNKLDVDGQSCELTLPDGALYASTEVTITQISSEYMSPWEAMGWKVISPAWEISAPIGIGINPAHPARVTLSYNKTIAHGQQIHLYRLRVEDGGLSEVDVGPLWDVLSDEVIDPEAGTISGETDKPFSLYVVMVEPAMPYAHALWPVDGATDVNPNVILCWSPGINATSHHVYFGDNLQDVQAGTGGTYKGTVTTATFTPGTLEPGKTYYWRIDEFDGTNTYTGDVWSFTTVNYLVVDDFEGYDDVNNVIYNFWEDYYVNNTGMTVGYFHPPFAERSIVHSGLQAMYMRYDNDGIVNEGTAYEKAGTLLYSEAERQWAEPQDWTKDGANALAIWFRGMPMSVGSFTVGPPIKMTALGVGIWGEVDQFHFAYKSLSGDGSIIVRVVSLSSTQPWAGAAVMIRESLAASSTHAMVVLTPSNGVALQYRPSTGAASKQAAGQTGITAPQWLRLTRSGNEFSNVTMTGSVTGAWKSQDIGIGNTPEQLYLIVQDSAGKSVMVKHSDPAATTISTWAEWNIPLTSFIGVNLQAIKKLSIGVGDKANLHPGGAGALYIDDIRLYRE